MATPGVSDGVVVEDDEWHYVGQVRTGTQTAHGRGTSIWKDNGDMYEGEWKDGKLSGQGGHSFGFIPCCLRNVLLCTIWPGHILHLAWSNTWQASSRVL